LHYLLINIFTQKVCCLHVLSGNNFHCFSFLIKENETTKQSQIIKNN